MISCYIIFFGRGTKSTSAAGPANKSHIAIGKPAWFATTPINQTMTPPINPAAELIAITVPDRPRTAA